MARSLNIVAESGKAFGARGNAETPGEFRYKFCVDTRANQYDVVHLTAPLKYNAIRIGMTSKDKPALVSSKYL